MINSTKLTEELRSAGIEISGCNSSGIVWDLSGNEIQDRLDVLAIIQTHDPVDYTTSIQELLMSEAPDKLRNIPGWATWDVEQAVDYINTNVTSLATAKTVLVAMAKMLVVLRDIILSNVVAEERHKKEA